MSKPLIMTSLGSPGGGTVEFKSSGVIPTVVCDTAANDPIKEITIEGFDPNVTQDFYIQFTNGVFDEGDCEELIDSFSTDEDFKNLVGFIYYGIEAVSINGTQYTPATVIPELHVLSDDLSQYDYGKRGFIQAIAGLCLACSFYGYIHAKFTKLGDERTLVLNYELSSIPDEAAVVPLNYTPYAEYSTHGLTLNDAVTQLRAEGNSLVYTGAVNGRVQEVTIPLPGKQYTLAAPAEKANGNTALQLSDGETPQTVHITGNNGLEVYTKEAENEIHITNTGITAVADPVSGNEAFYTSAITAASAGGGWDNTKTPQRVSVKLSAPVMAIDGGALTLSIDGSPAYPICYTANQNLSSYTYNVLQLFGRPTISMIGVTGYLLLGADTVLDLFFNGNAFTITSTSDAGITSYSSAAISDIKDQLITSYVRNLTISGGELIAEKGDGTTASLALPDASDVIDEIATETVNNTALTGVQSITLTDKQDNLLGEVSSLAIALPDEINDGYISGFSFSSGSTATVIDCPETVKWINGGTDVAGGVFSPAPNMRYTVVVWNDGMYVCGTVGGVGIEPASA